MRAVAPKIHVLTPFEELTFAGRTVTSTPDAALRGPVAGLTGMCPTGRSRWAPIRGPSPRARRWGESQSRGHAEPRQREAHVRVDPLLGAGEPRAETVPHDLLGLVFIRALGPDPILGREDQLEVRRFDAHALTRAADKVHLDPART